MLRVQLREQRVHSAGNGSGIPEPIAAQSPHLDGPIGEDSRVRLGVGGLQQSTGGLLGAFYIGLIEGVDA